MCLYFDREVQTSWWSRIERKKLKVWKEILISLMILNVLWIFYEILEETCKNRELSIIKKNLKSSKESRGNLKKLL